MIFKKNPFMFLCLPMVVLFIVNFCRGGVCVAGHQGTVQNLNTNDSCMTPFISNNRGLSPESLEKNDNLFLPTSFFRRIEKKIKNHPEWPKLDEKDRQGMLKISVYSWLSSKIEGRDIVLSRCTSTDTISFSGYIVAQKKVNGAFTTPCALVPKDKEKIGELENLIKGQKIFSLYSSDFHDCDKGAFAELKYLFEENTPRGQTSFNIRSIPFDFSLGGVFINNKPYTQQGKFSEFLTNIAYEINNEYFKSLVLKMYRASLMGTTKLKCFSDKEKSLIPFLENLQKEPCIDDIDSHFEKIIKNKKESKLTKEHSSR